MRKIIYLLLSISLLTSCDSSSDIDNNNIPIEQQAQLSQTDLSEDSVETKNIIEEKEEEIENNSDFEEVVITRVVDGDTAEYEKDGQKIKLRFIGVDTPETVHPTKGTQYYGPEASNFTKEQLEGKTVYLEKDVSDIDRYGRALRYIWLKPPKDTNNISKEEIDSQMYNAILVKEGYATTDTFPPDVKYEKDFVRLQDQAQSNKKGLWQDPDKIGEKVEKEKEPKGKGKIKGNINSKIYHLPSGKHYNSMKEENIRYFETEKEAQKAGYRKSKN